MSRLKEELIHELGKASRTAKKENQAYLDKIQALEEVGLAVLDDDVITGE